MKRPQPGLPASRKAGPAGSLYVYYRAKADSQARLLAAFARLLQLQQQDGRPADIGVAHAAPRLMRRHQAAAASGTAASQSLPASEETWLEIWPDPQQRFESLAHAIACLDEWAGRSGLAQLACSQRHYEWFEAVTTPAQSAPP